MKKLNLAFMALAMTAAQHVFAGGLLTNTNQNIAFNRNFSRDAAIGIDGVYSNPAGVAFLGQGAHISLNWQTVIQTRTIKNEYPLFANNADNSSTQRTFKGKAFAPVLPSIQFAYNWKNFSFQSNFAVGGGGGKCTFDDGLGSFEKIVSETALAASGLAQTIDAVAMPGQKMFSSDAYLGSTGKYSFNSYMRGRQYYYGLSLGAAYKINPSLSVFAGVRGVYALTNYYGYVRDITVGNMPLYQMLDPTKTNSADIELNCDQSGIGFTPILGVDYKLGRWNFAAKYEFKTRIRLKNKSVNQAPSIGNLPANLVAAFVKAGVSTETATAILSTSTVAGTMQALKTKFDTELSEAIGEYEDGKKVPGDIPALLTVGVGYNPIDPLRVNVGFHYYWDKQAEQYNHREEKLKRGTIEVNAGVEYDASKLVTVSAGWQNTSYGLTSEYMNDKSFVASSNSVGAGVCLHLTKKMNLNLAYFCTLYGHEKTSETALGGEYKADYTRTNHVFGAGLDIDF
ncbi:MAG: outer membrane beta-barrel protein [Prevotella sp.]|nr:outer membrane beta-barrel protein [Prevotella sp.]